MQIRTNQVEDMSTAKKEESFRRLLVDLRQSSPFATSHLDDASLLTIIEQATAKAHAYGITSNKATTDFVKMAVFAGISFDEDPAVQQFLRTPDLDPDYKVTLLAELAAQKLNDEE
jgi:hypothetical protein